jgi:hypothetical protein
VNFFEALNKVDTSLDPISLDYWESMHKWIYDEIGKQLTDDHIVDLGCGCGLCGIYLVYKGYVKTAELHDGRQEQTDYARKLIDILNLNDKITVTTQYAHPTQFKNKTIIAIRFGSLENFEKFIMYNKLITVRRTKEVEPLFIRNQNLPWNISLIEKENFQLELMTYDFNEVLKIMSKERWMEDLNPLAIELLKMFEHESTSYIGGDTIKEK